MMNRSSILTALLTLLLAMSGCDDPAGSTTIRYAPGFESERSPYVVNGTVTDEHGLPVEGAAIHFLCTMGMTSAAPSIRAAKAMPTTTIGYTIPKETNVSLKIFRLGTRELIATLAEGSRSAGSYTVGMDLTKLTNGWYIYQFVTPDDFQERLMLFMRLDLSDLLQTTPLTRTDAEGHFRLPHSLLGLQETIFVTNETGPEIIGTSRIDSIGLVAYHNGRTAVRWMRVDTQHNTTAALTLN